MILKHVIAINGRAATEAEETESPRAADGVASSAGITATVRKSDRVFRKLNVLALFSVPLLLGARLTNTRLMAVGYSMGFGRLVSSQPSCRRELGDPIDREVGQARQDRAKIVADRDF
jgi:hypothetical protein